MISVRIADIPVYLHEGGFYQGLDVEKRDESVFVPANCLKMDETISSDADLIALLTTLQFWAMTRLPHNIASYIMESSTLLSRGQLASFSQSFPLLDQLTTIKELNNIDDRNQYAIENGVLYYLNYAHENGINFAPDSCNWACSFNQLDVLQFLVRVGYKIDETSAACAIFVGSTDCLQYLLTLVEGDDDMVFAAAMGDEIECLKVLFANGCTGCTATLAFVAGTGRLKAVKFLLENNCPFDATVCAEAASTGHLECLQCLHEQGCPWDADTAFYATTGGHLDCLVYAHTHGAPLDTRLYVTAACSGHLECLNYLRAHGQPWDAEVCRAAAQYGKLDILQYAHENGCPWDSEATHAAARMAEFACLRYLVEHGCPFDQARFEAELADAPPHMPADKMRDELRKNCVQS